MSIGKRVIGRGMNMGLHLISDVPTLYL